MNDEQNIISAIAASNGTNYLLTDATKSAVSVDMVKTDVNLQHISQEDYQQLVEESATVSNWVYFVSSEYEDAYGQQIKNLAPGTDLSDAVNLEQLAEVSSRAYDTYTQTEVDQKIASAQYFKKYVVQTLPLVADADERGIYLVPSTDQQLSNTYDEYVVVGEGSSKAWEKIGAKNIDLSGYKTKQTAVPSPTASSTTTSFIDTITQNENGEITATKKTVQSASTTQAGIVQLNNTLTSTSTGQAATANAVKLTNDKFADYSLTSHTHSDYVLTSRTVAGQALTADVTAATISSAIGLDQYLTAVPSDYKTYAQTKQSLSGDGYATQDQLNEKSAVSVDGEHADVNIVHISQEDYNQLVADDEVLSNVLYVISSDYVETYGQQIKNVADPTDLSDAVNKEYVDSNFQPSGSYLTAVPDAYKTYAATLSSLSSTYSLTSHTHGNYVPTSRTVAGMQLTGDITLKNLSFGSKNYNGSTALTVTAGDLGALTAHQAVSATYADQHIYLSANGARVGDIDCSDFIKDGMLETVELCSKQLVFKFNTDAGKTAISVALSNFIDETNYYTKAELTGTSGVLKDYSLTSHTHSQYLTAVPSDYKTYSDTKSSLSSDGYATQMQLGTKSSVSVDNEHADANIIHISQEEYNQLVVDDEVLSNVVYVISSDYINVYGQQIKNVADPTDLSDAVNKEYVDSNFQPSGSYLTAVPDAYKTYAATLSSLSSTYSLTSHAHSQYLTAVPSTYKTYSDTKSSLSSDGYAARSELGYALSTATGVLSSGSYVYDVKDRTINDITLDSSVTSISLVFPEFTGYARDFFVRLTISDQAADLPTIYLPSSGAVIDFGKDALTNIDKGINLLMFSEILSGHWLVAVKEPEA